MRAKIILLVLFYLQVIEAIVKNLTFHGDCWSIYYFLFICYVFPLLYFLFIMYKCTTCFLYNRHAVLGWGYASQYFSHGTRANTTLGPTTLGAPPLPLSTPLFPLRQPLIQPFGSSPPIVAYNAAAIVGGCSHYHRSLPKHRPHWLLPLP